MTELVDVPRRVPPGSALRNGNGLPKATVVFDTYWRFAAERQRVYFARLLGWDPPWTGDPIIGAFRFTNPYRAADRVSQYLIRHVIYREDLSVSPEDLFFRHTRSYRNSLEFEATTSAA